MKNRSFFLFQITSWSQTTRNKDVTAGVSYTTLTHSYAGTLSVIHADLHIHALMCRCILRREWWIQGPAGWPSTHGQSRQRSRGVPQQVCSLEGEETQGGLANCKFQPIGCVRESACVHGKSMSAGYATSLWPLCLLCCFCRMCAQCLCILSDQGLMTAEALVLASVMNELLPNEIWRMLGSSRLSWRHTPRAGSNTQQRCHRI